MVTLLLAIGLIAVAFALIGVRSIFLKGGEFRGTCSSNNPMLKEKGISCPMCGAKADEECRQPA